MDAIFVTDNDNKYEEAKVYLKNINLSRESLDLVEIQGSVEEIVSNKAKQAFEILKKPCFVEDTSLEFEAWNGLPGPYIKEFLDRIGPDNIPDLLRGGSMVAKAICVIAFVSSDGSLRLFRGEVNGVVADSSTGFGWGFDRFFMVDGLNKRNAELSLAEKNKVSHRGKALQRLKVFL